MNISRLVKMLLPFLLLTACSTVTVKNPAPLPLETKAPVSAQEYRIQTGDLLDIKFFYNPELNESVTVRPDGRIVLQLIKEIDAVGKTPSQLTQLLSEKYSSQIKSPEIAVLVRSFSTLKVYVDGEVNKAGLVALAEPMTVLQAISQAGGAKFDTAKMEEVILIRKTSPNSKAATMTLNLEKALDGTDPSQDMTLMPYDIVFIPRTAITNVDLWVDQYIRKVLPFSMSVGYYYTSY